MSQGCRLAVQQIFRQIRGTISIVCVQNSRSFQSAPATTQPEFELAEAEPVGSLHIFAR